MTGVAIVPVGVNYFHGHRFRSRVYVEYGDPTPVPIDLIFKYRLGGKEKIDAVNALLDIIKDQVKSVTIQSPNYRQLQVLWAVRRLYQPSHMRLPPKIVTIIIRRFCRKLRIG
eukprot:UN07363